jgi:leader peptidase (prepilin peptidase)/N-methyltransferase
VDLLVPLLFVWGLVFGSFFNTLIYRLPRRISLVRPASSCPACGHELGPRDLVPVLSFAWQGGRCRYCRAPISWQYPAVELATAALFALTGWRKGLVPALLPALVLESTLIVAAGTDLTTRLIPNRLVLGALVLGAAAVAVGWPPASWPSAVLGGALLFVVTYAVAVLSRGGLGGGDVKLSGVMGLLLGVGPGIVALLVAFLTGGLAGSALLLTGRRRRRDAVPFGPYLAVGGVVAALFGTSLVHWYLGLTR